MPRPCRTPGCHEAAHGFSPFCENHKKTARRHGAPTQQGVTVHELKPYVALVEARKAKNPDSEVWTILTARWEAVLSHAQGVLQRHADGHIGVRWERLAAHHLVTIGRDVEPWSVVKTALAMFLMLDQRPTRFASDAAFDHQLVRRVRGLTDTNAGKSTLLNDLEHLPARLSEMSWHEARSAAAGETREWTSEEEEVRVEKMATALRKALGATADQQPEIFRQALERFSPQLAKALEEDYIEGYLEEESGEDRDEVSEDA